MGKFVHLHVHSEYSLLDGASRIKELPKRAKELGMDALALTDHGTMFGVIDFYKECKKNEVKPIIGCEVYVAPRTRFDKEANIDNKYNHLILLAKNNNGYKNLIKLVSLGFTDGYYYKPRIDLEILEKYHEDLICLSACLAGSIPQDIMKNDIPNAIEKAKWFKKIFKDDFYLELQYNGLKEQQLVNQKLIEISKGLDIKLVATNDVHYLKKEDAFSHDVLLCIQTGKTLNDIDRMKFETEEFYVKSPEEMEGHFKNLPEVLANTLEIADKCNVDFEFGVTKLPTYIVPEEYKTHEEYFIKLCEDGLNKNYENITDEIKNRLDYEIGIITKMGFIDYFLIVWDFINYSRLNDIPVGPGRGSGAGSLAAYALGITDIDPIKYSLLFERFLNPERISMPDFDIDFCYERRQEVIDYVGRKYGQEHVSQIITFGTMSARMVIRDVGRALDVPYSEVDRLAKLVPNELNITIEKALEISQDLKSDYNTNENTKKLLDIAMKLEGLPRHASTHAAGVVIAKDEVDSYVPLYVNDGLVSTQFPMTTLEELGLLKMDFLGLRTLTVIADAIKLVKQNRNIDVKFDEDFADQKVYEIWQKGKTAGIFQFESGGMTNFMKKLKPDCFEDIVSGVSLYRPGPMDQIPRYIKNKQNQDEVEYTHPSLEPILKVTYGCMVYQEQVIQIVRDLAGYSLGHADLVRRSMGKKKLDVMAKERDIFIHGKIDEDGNVLVKGCVRNGIDEVSANKIFDEMAEFAKYAFNKSHAAAYSVLSYQTAFLKTYYPQEFMAATLNSFLGNLDKIPIYIYEAKIMGIEILKPSINKSYAKFTVDDGKIRFGIASIKNVGNAAIDTIVEERAINGEYKRFEDFAERLSQRNVNKKSIEGLIKAGAFDDFGKTRATLLASFENIVDSIVDSSKKSITGQVSLYDLGGEDKITSPKYRYIERPEYSTQEILSAEKDVTGFYISGHPLEEFSNIIEKKSTISTIEVAAFKETGETKLIDGQEATYIGVISHVKKIFTKRNTEMAFMSIEDLFGTMEIVAFDRVYETIKSKVNLGDIVQVKGKLSMKDDNISILSNQIELFKKDEFMGKTIKVDITNYDRKIRDDLKLFIKQPYSEGVNVEVQVVDNGKIIPCGKIYFDIARQEALKKLIKEIDIHIL